MGRYKTSSYTILDPDYFSVLEGLTSMLNQKEIPYAVVGGTAFQIKIASILSENGNKDIKDIDNLEVLLRETGDIDLTTTSDAGEMMTFFSEMAALYESLRINNQSGKSAYLI